MLIISETSQFNAHGCGARNCRLSATPWALLVQGPALMVVRDTFLAELKTLFGLVVAGFEPGFLDPKARALPLRQSYAV